MMGFLSLCDCIQTSSGAHPAFFPVGTRGSFPGSKALGLEADHSPPSSAEVKNVESCTSIPQYIFMMWYLIKWWICLHGVVLCLAQRHLYHAISLNLLLVPYINLYWYILLLISLSSAHGTYHLCSTFVSAQIFMQTRYFSWNPIISLFLYGLN
jgi:hypothetical protein